MTVARLQLPQADRLSLLVALLEAVSRGVETIHTFSAALSVTTRQVHYYAHAASFLGLLQGEEGRFSLTTTGRKVLDTDPDRRFEAIVGLALAHPSLAELLLPLADETEIDSKVIAKAIEGSGYGPATAERRSQTIVGWFRQAGLDLVQSLRAGCPIRDQLSIFDGSASTAPSPKEKEEEKPERPEEPRASTKEATIASFDELSLPAPIVAEGAIPQEAPAPQPLPQPLSPEPAPSRKKGTKAAKKPKLEPGPSEPAPVSSPATEPGRPAPEERLPEKTVAEVEAPFAPRVEAPSASPLEEKALPQEVAFTPTPILEEPAHLTAAPSEEPATTSTPEVTPLSVTPTETPEEPPPIETEAQLIEMNSSVRPSSLGNAPGSHPEKLPEPAGVEENSYEVVPLLEEREPPKEAPSAQPLMPEGPAAQPTKQEAPRDAKPEETPTEEREPARVIPIRQLSLVPQAPKEAQLAEPSQARPPRPAPRSEAKQAPKAKQEHGIASLREVLEKLEDDDDVFGLKASQESRTKAHLKGPLFVGVALRASLEPGRATILCRLSVGAKPAATFREVSTTAQIVSCLLEEGISVIAVAAPLWLPGEGLERELLLQEKDDPDLWVARPWTRSPFVGALGFARVELEGSSPGLAARGRCLRETLAQHGVSPRMTPANQEDPGPRLIEVHPGLTLAALANAAEKDTEKLPPGRRLRRAVEEEAGPVEIPLDADARHRDALAAAWTALKFSKGAAWSPEGSSLQAGFVVVPFLG